MNPLTVMPETHDSFIPTRQSLLTRLKDWDDRKSWNEFFETYWRLIHATARKAGLSETEAQEVVQETIVSVAKKMPDFKYDPSIGSFKGWLMQLTRWRITDQFRKRRPADAARQAQFADDERRTEVIERVADPNSLNLDAVWEEEWARHITDAAVERVKQQVSAKQFQIFDLYVLKEWPVRKVAATLGVSSTQVYLAKHRIGGLLKKEAARLEKEMI